MMYLRMFPIAVIIAAILMASAGRADAWPLLAYPLVAWLSMATVNTVLMHLQPELVAERLKPPSDRDKKSRIASVPLLMVHYVIAGLDVRFGWSTLPPAAHVAGFLLMVLGLSMVGWTLSSNPYASSAVRIQSERGHRVISTGPYGIVRHPMYLGVLIVTVGSPLALGSLWSALPLLVLLAVFARRTLVEDAMLHDELPGYAEYARRVRFRVVPPIF
jgi:protein-S-isoprenylcysteine O-methyltransferase Ste14